jgi:uncharacterized protein YjdB
MKKYFQVLFACVLCINSLSSKAQYIYTYAGNGMTFGFPTDGDFLTNPGLGGVYHLTLDNSGNVYFSTILSIWKIDVYGIITRVAGTGMGSGYSGDGGPATAASIFADNISFDPSGNMYFPDPSHNVIRKVNTTGIISTVAGSGIAGYAGDGGTALSARFDYPEAVAADAVGNIFIFDLNNNRIRKVNNIGVVSTYAGTGVLGYSGDGGLAVSAKIAPATNDMIIDASGNLYFGTRDNRIRKINNTGIISTIAGNGLPGFSGDGGFATSASIGDGISYNWGLSLDGVGNLFISNGNQNRIRKVNTSGIISSICGNGTAGYSGDAGLATSATINTPQSVKVDASGNIYIADEVNNVIRKITPAMNNFPFFTGGASQSLSTCTGIAVSINSLMAVSDADLGQTLAWSVVTSPSHGTLAGFGVTAASTGSAITPSGLSYTSTSGYVGPDTFKVRVFDGVTFYVTTVNIVVTPAPTVAVISGSSTVCIGSAIALTDATSGGTWSSGSPSIAAVGSGTGIVTGVVSGTSVISYTISSSCGNVYATKTVTVNPLPLPVTGAGNVCAGSTVTLSDATSGGSWSSGSILIATVGSSTGIVSGVSSGTSLISYILPTGCMATSSVTVNPLPSTITGSTSICIGTSSALGSTPTGGTWSSSNPLVATIGSLSGLVTSVAAGSTTITYTLPTGCKNTTIVTVNPPPSAITGTTTICAGSATTLSDATTGGTWSSSSTAVATIGSATGFLSGVSAGVANITYSTSTGCNVITVVTVNPAPSPISGTTSFCEGATVTLSNTTTGGAWSSGNISVATIGSVSGVVNGISPGTSAITYTLSAGCYTNTTVTINPMPFAGIITGFSSVCEGANITLTDGATGGSWSSSATAVASIVSGTGVVTGVANGVTIVSYTVTNVCGTAVATIPITVNPLPNAETIIGSNEVCENETIALTDMAAGGIWAASNGNASVSAIGIVTGVTAGTVTISYTVTNICGSASAVSLLTIIPTAICIAGVNTVSANSEIRAYPNPSRGIFSIDLPQTNSGSVITIVDVFGRVLETKAIENNNAQTWTFNLGNIASGSYFVKVSTADKVFREKITIIK